LRFVNTIKGWFGYKPTNCDLKLSKKKILDIDLKSKAVNLCSTGVASVCKCKDLAWYLRWWNTVKGWFGSKPTNCNPKLSKKKLFEPTFFNKFAEVFRNKGLPMELYTKPVAEDLLEKLPNFVDKEPMNEGIKFYNEFAKVKNILLSLDTFDASFMKMAEKCIMTWAITPESELTKLHNVYKRHKKISD